MTTRLTAIDGEYHVVLDPSLLAGLKMGPGTPLEVTTDGKGIYIRPKDGQTRETVLETAERVMDVHAETLRKLAL